MTPFESSAYFVGHGRKRDAIMRAHSVFVAALMNCWVVKGHSVRPEDLYRPHGYEEPPSFSNRAGFDQYMRERVEEDDNG